MLRSRRWALTSLGVLFSAALLPSIAFAKKRRRKRKKKPESVSEPETPPTQAEGDALKDAHLFRRDGSWYLKNRSPTQRIIVVTRTRHPESRASSLDAFSLEPGQEVSVGVAQADMAGGPRVSIAGARYDA